MAMRYLASLGIVLSAILLTASTTLQAATPIVPAFERLRADGKISDADAGRLLLGELNCTSCHAGDGALIDNKQAPVLTEVGARIKPDYLKKYIADPHGTKPGTTMPNLFEGVSAGQRDEQAIALTHYLVSLGASPKRELPSVGSAVMGEQLFETVGCAVCHGSRAEGAKPLPTDKPLGDLTKKYTLPSLSNFLRDPMHVRRSGRMPSMNLSGLESKQIAGYLLDLPEVANLMVSVYEGSWGKLPDFSKLKPISVGGAAKIDVSVTKSRENFGLRFEGGLSVDTAGEYEFWVASDDGSRVLVDGKIVVDNDGIHGTTEKGGKVTLGVGLHAVVVEYFEKGGQEVLKAEFAGPGLKRQPLGPSLSYSHGEKKAPEENLVLKTDPLLVGKGRQLFATIGCASCHEVKEAGKLVASKFLGNSLSKLNGSAGCLAAKPTGKAPGFHLNDVQRNALATALKSPVKSLAPEDQIAHTLATFNCYACHKRGEIGGIELTRNGLFKSTIPEMGDEGRIPPPLSGVGGKLNPEWLKQILAEGAKDRPYMLTRMPKFGSDNVGHLQPLMTKLDALPPQVAQKFDVPSANVKRAGHKLVGATGLSCIKCHTFGRFKATGIQSIDMQLMAKRIQPDWFRSYLLNPQQFRPGTRMPSAWPPGGQSFLKDVLDGKNETQIAAVWEYLKDGTRAHLPRGLVTGSMELVPIGEAVIYRNFIQDAGPRAIGIGYPEGVNLAFDANEMRIALLWQGQFIDAKKHWTGRGQGFEGPLGENILKLPATPPLGVLVDDKWPSGKAKEIGYKFRGYKLSPDQRPTFLYSYQGVTVEDTPDTATPNKGALMSRKFQLATNSAPTGLVFRAASGKIQDAGDGWFDVGGVWKTRVTGGKAEVVGDQLILLVEFKNGKAEITQDYAW